MPDTRAETRQAQEAVAETATGPASALPTGDAWRRNSALPGYVRRCGKATLVVFNRATGESAAIHCKCKGWKCPECITWRNRIDSDRLAKSLREHGAGDHIYMVCTMARRDYAARKSRPAVTGHAAKRGAWLELNACEDRMRRELAKHYRTTCPAGAQYRNRFPRSKKMLRFFSSIEQHADGYPHRNFLLYSPELVARWRAGDTEGVKAELRDIAIRAGFGFQFHCEPVDPTRDLATYLVKQAPGAHNMNQELLKATQVPIEGGAGFRRIRSSWYYLPKLEQSGWIAKRINVPLQDVQRDLAKLGPEAFFSREELAGVPSPKSIGSILASLWPLSGNVLDSARSGAERRTAFVGKVRRIGTGAPDEPRSALAAPGACEVEWNGDRSGYALRRSLSNWIDWSFARSIGALSKRDRCIARTARDLARSLGARAEGVGGAQRPLNLQTNISDADTHRERLSGVRSSAPPTLAPCG